MFDWLVLPLALGIGFLFLYVFALMIAGGRVSRTVERNEAQDAEIDLHCDNLSSQRVSLLGQLGKPANNGDWNADQKAIWVKIEALKREEADFLKETKVVNLDPLGHNIGRVYKQKPQTETQTEKPVTKQSRSTYARE